MTDFIYEVEFPRRAERCPIPVTSYRQERFQKLWKHWRLNLPVFSGTIL